MVKKQLKELAEVVSGYSFRESVNNIPCGRTLLIQSKDLAVDSININLDSLRTIESKGIKTKAYLEKGDVLVGAKGSSVIGYFDTSDALTLVTSSVLIVRMKSDLLNPKYLAIFLRSRRGQRELERISSGEYIMGISKTNLEDLVLPVPDISFQEKVISIYENLVSQNKLLRDKLDINNDILDYVVGNLNY